MRRLRWVYGLLAAFLLAILGYTAFWFHLKGRVEQGLAEWSADRRSKGWQVVYGPPAISGYPYRLVVDLKDLALADPTHPQAWALTLPAIRVLTHPWTLRHILLQPSGPLDVAWGPNGARSELHAKAEQWRASLVLDTRDRLQRLSIEAKQPSLDLAYPRFDGRFRVFAEHAELHLRDNRGVAGAKTAADLAASGQQVATSFISPGPPFGRTIAALSLDLGLTGRIDTPNVARWRDDGGTVELLRAAVRWGPLDATATGTLALDNQMRPIGAATAEAKGWEAVIDRLGENKHFSRGQARALKLGLGLLSQTAPDGTKVLKAPISAQDGHLYVGPVQVLELPPLPLE
jgi:hypothetical protein